jgi:deoxycytidine triphosphate deaminase
LSVSSIIRNAKQDDHQVAWQAEINYSMIVTLLPGAIVLVVTLDSTRLPLNLAKAVKNDGVTSLA